MIAPSLLSPRRPRSVVAVAVVGAVLALGTAGARADLPAGAGATVVGELVQVQPEDDPGHAGHTDGAPLSYVETADGAVRVPTGDVDDLPAGSTVRVTLGGEVADEASTEDGVEPARDVLSAAVVAAPPAEVPLAAAAGGVTNAVTVVMVTPAGVAQDGRTLDSIVNTVNGPVSQFWSGQSRGAVVIGVTASVGWTPLATSCSNPLGMWQEAASKVGWTAGPGKHLLLYVSAAAESQPGCSYGLAEVAPGIGAGGRAYVRDIVPTLVAHELGHNFGLGHSSGLQCDAAVDTGACQVAAYRDLYDVMGVSWERTGSLNAAQASLIGLLPPWETVALSAGSPATTVSLAPLSAASGVRGVRLAAADGRVYWLENRVAAGQDAWIGAPGTRFPLQTGVLVRRLGAGSDSSLLLDATPSGRAGWDGDVAAALPTGVPVTLGGFTLTVTAAGPGGATVTIAPAGGAAAPVAGSGDIGGSGSAYFLNDSFSGRANVVLSYGAPDDMAYSGDWDGNRSDSLMVRRGNTFFPRNVNSSGPASLSFVYGDPGDTVLVGDWDGNGTDTLAVRRGNQYFVKNSVTSGFADAVVSYGDPGDAVLVGDWDGNGTDSLAVRRGNQYFVRNTITSGFADSTFTYGDVGDRVVVGRWSPAQRGDTLAVRRDNQYFLRFSLTAGFADQVVAYGDPGDTAFAGDWDGNGLDSLGVRRP
ncbi:hypothetical protein GB931_20795 [Modestobacter sp. I12A-02628]|uniref:Peptidase M11 gametolysin domain-containing protein n=1 Tax=Goekera deserti TaxID=2497753 RepID=A0A7K3W9X5_9ACTN|nr:hypothetical protein [Goekera deserti]MPR00312.1 hypothetical protein [Goekera deserti]NDI49486.1 hypothetical protein [Goekera deserti]NEL52640.1 hypothetical protein [Goekera deserti]